MSNTTPPSIPHSPSLTPSLLLPDGDRLNRILNDQELCDVFREFLDETHCTENLFFYKEIERFQQDFSNWSVNPFRIEQDEGEEEVIFLLIIL